MHPSRLNRKPEQKSPALLSGVACWLEPIARLVIRELIAPYACVRLPLRCDSGVLQLAIGAIGAGSLELFESHTICTNSDLWVPLSGLGGAC